MSETVVVGRVVISKAGRDKDQVFIITKVLEDGYVLVANGKERKLENPKKKKMKHLSVCSALAENIQLKLLNGLPVFDAEIRKSLTELGFS